MKQLLRAFLICTVSLLCIHNSQAVPAYPHPITITLPDGTELTIKLYGDEFFNYTLTIDDYQIIQKEDGFYYYYTPDIYSKTVSSGELVRATDPAVRTRAQLNHLSTISSGVNAQYLALGRAAAKLKREMLVAQSSASRTPTPPYSSTNPTSNQHPTKGIVILAQYQDIKFQSSNTKATFEALLNKRGYSVNGAIGSARDYYIDNSQGQYSPEFTVSPIVTLPRQMAYYGGNNAEGGDLLPAQMARDACAAADRYINFAEFSTLNPGHIDMVFVFFAGHNESEGGPAETIWPHRWSAGSYNTTGSLIFDGVRLGDYACTSELSGPKGTTLCGIGTFAHEYSHVLGLMDYYDTDYSGSGGASVGLYNLSIMSGGSYNSGGNIPPYYSNYDKMQLGWNTSQNMNESLGQTTIYPVNTPEGNDAWIIEADTENEFFVIESRSNEKWDAPLKATGLLIYHIDYSTNSSGSDDNYGIQTAQERWGTNTINTNPEHPCVRFIESYGATNSTLTPPQIYYPGSSNRTTFSNDDYGFKDWNGRALAIALQDITNNNGEVTLVVEMSSIHIVTPKQRDAIITYNYNLIEATSWTLKVKAATEGTWAHVYPDLTETKFVIEELEPNTTYTIQIEPNNASPDQIINENFNTKTITAAYTAIEIENRKGLLYVTNIQKEVGKIEWYINNKLTTPKFDPAATTKQSIECHITYVDGTGEIIKKTINPELKVDNHS